jgi:hypothetical protein
MATPRRGKDLEAMNVDPTGRKAPRKRKREAAALAKSEMSLPDSIDRDDFCVLLCERSRAKRTVFREGDGQCRKR